MTGFQHTVNSSVLSLVIVYVRKGETNSTNHNYRKPKVTRRNDLLRVCVCSSLVPGADRFMMCRWLPALHIVNLQQTGFSCHKAQSMRSHLLSYSGIQSVV